jgi:hypothetical protein
VCGVCVVWCVLWCVRACGLCVRVVCVCVVCVCLCGVCVWCVCVVCGCVWCVCVSLQQNITIHGLIMIKTSGLILVFGNLLLDYLLFDQLPSNATQIPLY